MPGTSMNAPQAFRYGFFLRCAEEGCDDVEIARRAKMAEKAAGALADLYQNTKDIGALTLGASVLGAGALGAGGGYALAKMQDPKVDVDDARRQELISTYDQYARQARLRSLIQKHRPVAKPTFSRF